MLDNPILQVLEKILQEAAQDQNNNQPCKETIKKVRVPYAGSEVSFESSLKPGNIFVARQGKEKLIGIILQGGTAIKVNSGGQIIGYMRSFDATTPLTIEAVYEPTSDVYALHNYADMKLIWKKAPAKVNKSLREIEDALGLEPGSLEIK